MATFDQLPAEQRAIIELVVARGRSYDALADVLQVSTQRVRELAREALVELSPVSARRVDQQWRGQVADYLLGQQSGAEATATRKHLERSEAARTWALSLLDALDTLFVGDERPEIPAAGEPAEEEPPRRERERERRGRTSAAAAVEEEREAEDARERDRDRERDREREREREREKERARARERERERAREEEPRELSPAARSALRRRRILGGLGAAVLVAAIVVGVLALTGAFSSDDTGSTAASTDTGTTPTTSTTPTGGQPQVLGQVVLRAQSGVKAQGVAYILQQGNQRVLAVTAKLPPLPATQRKAAYNVWLFNSPSDAASIGAQFTTPQGDYQGVGPLPSNYKRFKYIDVSAQPFNNKTGYSGNSFLRGALADLKPVPKNQQPGAGGTPTTPSP